MQQTPSVLSSREAARLIDADPTTIQRAIIRGELNASRPRDRAPYRIQRSDLLTWAAANGYAAINGDGERVDLATGEVLEASDVAEVTPIAAATSARARLAGVRAEGIAQTVATREAEAVRDGQFAAGDYSREPRFDSERLSESNVARIVSPFAEAGLLVAARRLVALPESPELWQALRAVLGVGE